MSVLYALRVCAADSTVRGMSHAPACCRRSMADTVAVEGDQWRGEVRESAEWCEKELRSVVRFWMDHSLDKDHG